MLILVILISPTMVRPGIKTAACYVCGYMMAQLLRERDVIEVDPMCVYYYSALVRDVMMLLPDGFEEYLDGLARRVAAWIKRMLDRLCGVEQQLPQ